jgi:hypothetical protein
MTTIPITGFVVGLTRPNLIGCLVVCVAPRALPILPLLTRRLLVTKVVEPGSIGSCLTRRKDDETDQQTTCDDPASVHAQIPTIAKIYPQNRLCSI